MDNSFRTGAVRRDLMLLALLLLSWSSPAVAQPATVAEESDYKRTSRHSEVERFSKTLAANSPHVRHLSIGLSAEQRPITGLVLANPMVATPVDLKEDTRLVVWLLGNIHAGECAGKEAILGLCRDIALTDTDGLLKTFVIVAVPNFNVDGNEQQGLNHRPGQVGPTAGVGLRENIQGMDLNRDFIKLDTPEARALAQSLRDWNPHIFIDTHTTNGSRHRYALTYDIAHNPAAPTGPRKWLRQTLLPQVTQNLSERKIETFYYGNFNDDKTRWTTFGHEPRYSSEYMGLRGRLAILSEAYSYLPYRDRIVAHREFIKETLKVAASHHAAVSKLLKQAAASAPQTQSIRAKNGPYPGKVTILGYRDDEKSAQGDELAPQDYQLTHYANFETTLEVKRPFAYLMGTEHGRVAQRLLWHGVKLHQLTKNQELSLDQSRVTKIEKSGSSFQGHRTTSLEVTRESSRQTIPAGTYVIYTKQPLAQLITYLLEPRSDDGFTTWNFFDHAIQTGKPHPVSRIARAVDLSDQVVKNIRPSAKLTLDQIYGPSGRISFGGSFPLSLRWLPKTADYRVRSGNRNYSVDAESGARTPLPEADYAVAEKKLETLLEVPAKAASKLAKGGQLGPKEKSTLYQHKNDLFLYEHSTQELRRLTNDKQLKQLVTFSADGRYVAFVRKYNLVIVPTSGGPEVPVTTEGAEHLLHGYLDWVYQEELYGRGNYRGFWWSPNSKALAFLQLDERPVAKYPITDHLAYRAKSQATYYPKAGDALPKVSLAIYQLGTPAPRAVDLGKYGDEILISHVNWSPDSQQLFFQVQNRQQTWLDLCTVRSDQSKPRRLLRETTDAWVQSPGTPHYLDDGSFLWLSEATGYRHIQHVSGNGRRRRALTAGEWEVQKILGIDEALGFVYFLGNRESGAESHAYRVPLENGQVSRLTRRPGNHSVRFNDSYSHYIDYTSGIHRPVSVSLHRADGTWLRTLAPNLVDHLEYYHLRQPKFVEFLARDGHPLSAVLIKPPNFDPTKQYPVLCHVYGGPQAPVVRNRWSGSTYLWHQYLAQQGYVIWISDNRAATHQGARGAWAMHLEMGKTELQDLEDGINWLGKNPWIDRQRVGIWGWSYGGYLVSYALTHSKLFKAGIAGAPVTDWRNYDAIYTERYMGLPQDNPEGYKKASPVHAASSLHGKLLLIHGALDDNVHLSNTLQFSNALQRSGKQFQLMIYPNNRHGITRPGQSRHLRDLMTQFILDNL